MEKGERESKVGRKRRGGRRRRRFYDERLSDLCPNLYSGGELRERSGVEKGERDLEQGEKLKDSESDIPPPNILLVQLLSVQQELLNRKKRDGIEI